MKRRHRRKEAEMNEANALSVREMPVTQYAQWLNPRNGFIGSTAV